MWSKEVPMPDIDLSAIKARAAAATPGPWTVDREHYEGDDYYPVGIRSALDCKEPMLFYFDDWADAATINADADFIAAAREDIPALVAEVERLWTESVLWEIANRQHEAREDDERKRLRAELAAARALCDEAAEKLSPGITETEAEMLMRLKAQAAKGGK
jgi:hypothetical protein